MQVDKIATGVANFINKSEGAQKVLRKVSDSPAMFSAVGAFLVGTTLRPAMTMAITPNKQDGVYSASSSIANSFVELAAGALMFTPMKKGIDESAKQLYNSAETIFHENKEILRNYKSTAKRLFRIPTFPITSAIRFAMVAPIAIGLGKLGISKSRQKQEEKRKLNKIA